jgi:uncharacterized protein YecT (DUF1311 family)
MVRHAKTTWSPILFLVFGSAFLSASGQSFDCAKAAGRYEKFICSHRELSAADSRMSVAYQAALAQLSGDGKRRLVESQRSWLKYGRSASPLDADYLEDAYRHRTKQLEKTVATVGPFKMESLTMYDKAKVEKRTALEEDPLPHFATGSLEFSFPRIESPRTPETERWNRLAEEHIRKIAGEPESGSDNEVRFGVTYASQDVISLLLKTSMFAAGTAHPNHDLEGYVVLLASGRELRASDLFTPAQPWKTFLNDIVLRKLKAQAAEEDGGPGPREGIELDADDVKRWTITRQGLMVSFTYCEVSGCAHAGDDVVVTWAELKPYLKTELPFAVPR